MCDNDKTEMCEECKDAEKARAVARKLIAFYMEIGKVFVREQAIELVLQYQRDEAENWRSGKGF